MKAKLSATVYTSYAMGASVVGVLRHPSALTFSTGPHGCDSCTVQYDVSENIALQLIATGAVFHLVVSSFGATIWSGRCEHVAIIRDGIELTAYGYWRALLDQPYTAMWSDTKLENWKLVDARNISGRIPSMYSTDTNNWLFIAPTKDSVYTSGSSVGEWGYAAPSGSSRQITAISFDWTANLPTDWYARVDRYTSAYSYQSTVTTFLNPDDGTVSTGTVSQTFTACDRVHVLIYYGGGGTYTYTGETGTNNLQLANIRVKTTTASTVTPDVIISDMLTLAPALSSSALETNDLDLTDAVFEDQYPGNIIEYLTRLGDDTGNRWEASVGADRILIYQQRGANAREWYADLIDLDFARSISEMWNSVYAVYKKMDGTDQRGTASTDANSTELWGLTRKLALPVETTASATANYHRDVALTDRKNPAVKTKLAVSPVGLSDLWQIRSGDYINIRNLPAMNFGGMNFSRFRIERTEYDAVRDVMTLQSEAPLSQLEFVIGQGFDSRPILGEPDPAFRRPDPARPENPVVPW